MLLISHYAKSHKEIYVTLREEHKSMLHITFGVVPAHEKWYLYPTPIVSRKSGLEGPVLSTCS